MKFKFKKWILKLEISTFKSLSHFLSLCEFGNFYRKLWAKKDGKFSSLLLVYNVPKLNLRKFLIISCESLKLSLQNRFLQMFDFLFLSYSQVKLNRDSDFDCS